MKQASLCSSMVRAVTRSSDLPIRRELECALPFRTEAASHRRAALLAPWQQIVLNAAAADVVKDLIGRAAVAVWNMEEAFHVADVEVGHAPRRSMSLT